MALFSSNKRILLAGNEGIVLFGPASGGVEREIALSWEVPGFDQQLTKILSGQNQGSPVLVLFDGADQTYRKEENIPKLSSFDRPRFIKRKLDQVFPNYPIRASIEIESPKRKTGGRGPSSYLFVAISETDRIDRLGNAMLEAGVPIAGFGLLPAESAGLVMTLADKMFGQKGKKSRWAILIGQHETGGLRQVVVKDGMLGLTRMTPASESGTQGQGWVDDVMSEFRATLTYIARLGYTPDEGLDVIVICSDPEKKLFEEKAALGNNFRCLNTTEALSAIGAKGEEESNFADVLHAAWASKKMSMTMPVKVPSINSVMVPRQGARIAGVALIFTFLAVAAYFFSAYQDYLILGGDVSQAQNRKNLMDQEYAQESKAFDILPVKPAVVRSSLAVKKLLDTSSVDITPTLNVLHRALERDIRLSELIFEHEPTGLQRKTPGAPSTGDDRGTVKILFRFSLLGSLPLEQKVTRAEAIAEIMKQAFPGYDVRIKSQFGNVSRTGRFEGAAGKSEDVAITRGEDSAEIEMQGVPL